MSHARLSTGEGGALSCSVCCFRADCCSAEVVAALFVASAVCLVRLYLEVVNTDASQREGPGFSLKGLF